MSGPIKLSPLGTAREAVATAGPPAPPIADSEQELLCWFRTLCEPLKSLYGVEDEVAMIAWELARWQPGLAPFEQQAVIMLVLTVLVHLRYGSTRLRLRGPEGRSIRRDLQESLGFVQAVELIETLIDAHRLDAIVGTEEEFKPLIVSGEHLYLQKMLYLENRFVAALRDRLEGAIEARDQADVERALRDVLGRPAIKNGHALTLRDEQVSAVRAATNTPIAIISGGPGSGKTTIVLSILRTLLRLGVTCAEVALAAPTGKAANRMGEAIHKGRADIAQPTVEDLELAQLGEPRTLHRLLGYSQRTGRFMHHANNPLAERVVIVDESSMIDLALMERLVRSLKPGSRLILLGDAHQLPSVEAGDVLRDLLAASEEKVGAARAMVGVRLVESHRMRADDDDGRNILAVARAVDQGAKPALAPTRTSDQAIIERPSVAEITFHGVEFLPALDGPGTLDAFLDRWHRDVIRSNQDVNDFVRRTYRLADGNFRDEDLGALRACFEHWEQSRLLCITRVSQTRGADRVNAALHERLLVELRLLSRRDHDLVAGEPVMMQVNDYDRGIFNGDQGLILNGADHGRPEPMATFRRSDGFVAFPVDSIRSVLGHSYAMTVHKAQGSEFDRLGLILPDRDLPINTREIMYTALTRSRRGVVIVGDRKILEAGIKRTIARDSGLGERLKAIAH